MSSWNRMNEDDTDQVILPPPERRMLDKTHFIEISYKQNDDGTIERLCRKGEITKKQKRVSRAARRRQEHFVKFGKVADLPNGFREKGITETRQEEFAVIWEGLSKQEQKQKMKQKNLDAAQAQREAKQKSRMENQSKLQQDAIDNQRLAPQALSQQKSSERRGYVAPGLRKNYQASYDDQEEETFEIRISNLPDSATQDDIRELMRAFFDAEYYSKGYNERPRDMPAPPSGRIKVYCFKSRVEQDTNAIVDVKFSYWQQKAIQELDGQPYGYNIIKVEKSKPKRRKY